VFIPTQDAQKLPRLPVHQLPDKMLELLFRRILKRRRNLFLSIKENIVDFNLENGSF